MTWCANPDPNPNSNPNPNNNPNPNPNSNQASRNTTGAVAFWEPPSEREYWSASML